MSYFFSVGIVFCFSLFYMTFFKRKFAEVISVSTCTIALLLYLLTFLVPLDISAMIVSCLGIIGFIYAFVIDVRRIKVEGFSLQHYLSYPFFCFSSRV